MATNEQLKIYVDSLPRIYGEILSAFPRIEPNRKQGYGLAFQTLAADFENRQMGIELGEIIKACEELEDQRIIEIKNRIFVHPTQLGERLIGIITGEQVPEIKVPKLPSLPV